MVIAAVKVVLPWSTWPMVPMLQWGLLLSNLALAILKVLLELIDQIWSVHFLEIGTIILNKRGFFKHYLTKCYK